MVHVLYFALLALFVLQMCYAGGNPISVWSGGTGSLVNNKGIIEANLSNYSVGSAKAYISVKPAAEGVANHPPVKADGTFHFFSNIALGSV